MEYKATITPNGVSKWPMHSHPYWEIMYYLDGEGTMLTENKKIPFTKHTVIVVPPNVKHGSSAKEPFQNVSIGGEFGQYFDFGETVSFQAEENSDGAFLCEALLRHSKNPPEYAYHLLHAYLEYLSQNLKSEDSVCRSAVKHVCAEILREFSKCDLNVSSLLKKTGYCEDYIRSKFQKEYGLAPVAFLQKVRIEHATHLMEIYASRLSVGKIAELCGFSDGVYFSRIFKKHVGVSPRAFSQRAHSAH